VKIVFRSDRPPRSRRQYAGYMVFLWIYTVVWLAALVVVAFAWKTHFMFKAMATVMLAVVTPTDGHFASYEKYREWYDIHVVPLDTTKED
jgi:hypothetical protein